MIEKRLRNVVVSGYGYKIKSRKGIVVIKKEGEKFYFSPKEIEQLIIAGDALITSGAVINLVKNRVDVVFVEHGPNFLARVVRNDYNFITDLHRKQIVMTEEKKLDMAREIVDALIYNKIRMLQQIQKNRDIDFSMEIDYLKEYRTGIENVSSKNILMGIEGEATKMYFSAFKRIIPKELGFIRRVKHPPMDPVNSMLSYGYTILFSRVSYALMLAGLNVFEGIFHESYRDRMALAYDAMEEFRQPIVDRVVITMVVRNMVGFDDFKMKSDMCYMEDDFKKKYLELLYSRFEERYNYEGKDYEFLDIIHEQAKKLANAILKDEKYNAFRYR